MKFFWTRKKRYTLGLSKLVCDIREMLNSNQLTMERYHAERIKMLFDEDGTPKKIRCRTGESSSMEIPLFMLTNHRVMQLSEMKVSLPIVADSINVADLNGDQKDSIGNYTVTVSERRKGKGECNIDILFSLKEDNLQHSPSEISA